MPPPLPVLLQANEGKAQDLIQIVAMCYHPNTRDPPRPRIHPDPPRLPIHPSPLRRPINPDPPRPPIRPGSPRRLINPRPPINPGPPIHPDPLRRPIHPDPLCFQTHPLPANTILTSRIRDQARDHTPLTSRRGQNQSICLLYLAPTNSQIKSG